MQWMKSVHNKRRTFKNTGVVANVRPARREACSSLVEVADAQIWWRMEEAGKRRDAKTTN